MQKSLLLLFFFFSSSLAYCFSNVYCGDCNQDTEDGYPCVWCNQGAGKCVNRGYAEYCPPDLIETSAQCPLKFIEVVGIVIASLIGCCCCCCVLLKFCNCKRPSFTKRSSAKHFDRLASVESEDPVPVFGDPEPRPFSFDESYQNPEPMPYIPPVEVKQPVIATPPVKRTETPPVKRTETPPIESKKSLPPIELESPTPIFGSLSEAPPAAGSSKTPDISLFFESPPTAYASEIPPAYASDISPASKPQFQEPNTTTYERALVELEGRVRSAFLCHSDAGYQLTVTDIDGNDHRFEAPDYRAAHNFGKRPTPETKFDLNFESAFEPPPATADPPSKSIPQSNILSSNVQEEKKQEGREPIQTPPAVILEEGVSLVPIDFHEIISIRQSDYFPGTREWVFEELEAWLNAASGVSRLFWLMGGAGTGKSTIAAQLFNVKGIRHHLVAWHFCQHDHPSESAVLSLVLSWASMLCANVPGFESALRETPDLARLLLSRDEKDFFDNLIVKPLRGLAVAPSHPLLLLVDALDELPQASLAPLLLFITELLPDLPDFVRLFITSRDVVVIKDQLQRFRPLELRVEEAKNQQDLRKFLAHVASKYVTMDMTIPDIEMELERQLALEKGSLAGKLEDLRGPIKRSQNAYDAVIQPIKAQPGYRALCSIDEVRPSVPPLQSVDDLNQLYADATEARKKLMDLFASEWRVLKVIGETVLQVPAESKAVSWIDNAVEPGLKGKDSTARKIRDEYKGNCRQMKDLARITAECITCERLVAAVDHMRKSGVLRILGLKNRYANLSPMGYRDINMTVEVQLSGGVGHICEIQANLQSMLVAKEQAHAEYETVRLMLPKITAGWSSKQASEFESRLLKLLRSSVLDSVVRTLETKAGGLFIYAALLQRHMANQGQGLTTSVTDVSTLPTGLSEIYQENFSRMVPANHWDKYVRVVALIGVAREPLSVEMIKQVVGAEEFVQFQAALSGIFPIRDNRLHVMHKSIVDWLRDTNRTQQEYVLTPAHVKVANRNLAAGMWRTITHFLDDTEQGSELKLDSSVDYALRYGVGHMCDAGLADQAGELALDLRWLLVRVRMQDFPALLADLEAISSGAKNPVSFDLLTSALRLALDDLRVDWRFLLPQLIARLIGHESKDSRIQHLLETARKWKMDKPWWYPIQQSLQPAGGSCIAKWPESSKALAWSPDFKVVSFGRNEKIRLMHTETGAWIHVFIGHSAAVECLAFSPDGTMLCSGGEDQTIRLWDVKTAECIRTYSGHENTVTSISWSPDSTKFCSGSEDGTARMWDVKLNGMKILAQGHEKVAKVIWGGMRIIIQAESQVSLLDLQTRRAVSSPQLPDSKARKIIHSADFEKIFYLVGGYTSISAGGAKADPEECTVYMMDKQGTVTELQGDDELIDICCTQDGNTLYLGPLNDVIVWNVRNKTSKRYKAQTNCHRKLLALSTDEKQLFSSGNACVYGWDLSTDTLTHTFAGLSDRVYDIFSVGSHLWTRADNDIRLWVTDRPCLSTIQSHTQEIKLFAWSPNGKVGCSYAADKTLRFWNATTGECLHTIDLHIQDEYAGVSALAFNSDGSKLAVAQSDQGVYHVWIYHLESDTRAQALDVGSRVTRLGWGSQDNMVNFQTESGVGALLVPTNKIGLIFEEPNAKAFVVSPDWETLAVGRPDNIVIISNLLADDPTELLLPDSAEAEKLSWNRDGKSVFALVGEAIRIWDAITGQLAQEFNANMSDAESDILLQQLIAQGFPSLDSDLQDFQRQSQAVSCSSSPAWGYAVSPINPSWAFAVDPKIPNMLHTMRRVE